MRVSNPPKVIFPVAGHTKLDLVRYYVAVGEGALRGIRGRPIVLKRYVVRPGDSLTAIAKRHGTTLSTLAKINRLDPAHPLLTVVLLAARERHVA